MSASLQSALPLHLMSDCGFSVGGYSLVTHMTNEICIAQWEHLVRQESEFESRCRCITKSDTKDLSCSEEYGTAPRTW